MYLSACLFLGISVDKRSSRKNWVNWTVVIIFSHTITRFPAHLPRLNNVPKPHYITASLLLLLTITVRCIHEGAQVTILSSIRCSVDRQNSRRGQVLHRTARCWASSKSCLHFRRLQPPEVGKDKQERVFFFIVPLWQFYSLGIPNLLSLSLEIFPMLGEEMKRWKGSGWGSLAPDGTGSGDVWNIAELRTL
jgi:hypothetical protein